MKGIMINNKVQLPELEAIELPETTETYKPVSYSYLVNRVTEIGNDYLYSNGFELATRKWGVGRDDQHMFGMHVYRNGSDGMDLSVGYRNSYNKEISIGLAFGAQVFVCENLMITGDIVMMRKHTNNVLLDLDNIIESGFTSSIDDYSRSLDARDQYERIGIDDNRAYEVLGRMYGNGVLGSRQLSRATKEWHKPSFDHQKGSAWTLYNSCTESLKSTQLGDYLDKHRNLHQEFELALIDDIPNDMMYSNIAES